MSKEKNQQKVILQVTSGLEVAVIKHSDYNFLIPVKDVAKGYGVSVGSIRSTQSRHLDEFVEGKHFIRGVALCNTLPSVQPHAVFWTKAGVVRLGFFITGERAKLFRDWAEKVILTVTAPKAKLMALPPAKKRKHNRLTQERLVDILKIVAEIEDKELRMRIVNQLTGN